MLTNVPIKLYLQKQATSWIWPMSRTWLSCSSHPTHKQPALDYLFVHKIFLQKEFNIIDFFLLLNLNYVQVYPPWEQSDWNLRSF